VIDAVIDAVIGAVIDGASGAPVDEPGRHVIKPMPISLRICGRPGNQSYT